MINAVVFLAVLAAGVFAVHLAQRAIEKEK